MAVTNDEIVARQARRIADLEDRLSAYRKAVKEINATLYCVGGPLNDNIHRYSREQLGPFSRIAQQIEGLVPTN